MGQMTGGMGGQFGSVLGGGNGSLKGLMGMLMMAILSGQDKDKDHHKDAADLLLMALASQTFQRGSFGYQSTTSTIQNGLSGMQNSAASSPMPPVGGLAAAYSGGAAGAGVGGAVNATA